MSDEQNLAQEASDEVVAEEAVTDETEVSEDTTEGQDDTQPAEASDEGQEEADSEAEEKKSRSKQRAERRKAHQEKLKADQADAERRAREAEDKLKRQQEGISSLAPPKEDGYGTFEEYQAALSAYHVALGLDKRQIAEAQREVEARKVETEAARAARTEEARQNWAAQRAEAQTRYPDFEQVFSNPELKISAPMADIISASDVAGDVAYYLGKNPELSASLSSLQDGPDLWRELGRIEAIATMPRANKVSQAPEPISPVRGKATAAKDPSKMNPAEYRTWRENGGKL